MVVKQVLSLRKSYEMKGSTESCIETIYPIVHSIYVNKTALYQKNKNMF